MILYQEWVYPVKKKGVTLIELLVVIAIIALLLSKKTHFIRVWENWDCAAPLA